MTNERVSFVGDGMLSDHLSKSEVRSKSTGTLKDINARLPLIFEIIRKYAGGTSVSINSAVRDYVPKGGVQFSEHMLGNAFDLGLSSTQMQNLIRTKSEWFPEAFAAGLRGLGVYYWGLHIDTDGQDKATHFWLISNDDNAEYLLRYWHTSGPDFGFVLSNGAPIQYGANGPIVDVEQQDDSEQKGFNPLWLVLVVLAFFMYKHFK